VREAEAEPALIDDLVMVCVVALRAELRRSKIKTDPNVLAQLSVAASMLILKRAGLMELQSAIALDLKAGSVKVRVIPPKEVDLEK